MFVNIGKILPNSSNIEPNYSKINSGPITPQTFGKSREWLFFQLMLKLYKASGREAAHTGTNLLSNCVCQIGRTTLR